MQPLHPHFLRQPHACDRKLSTLAAAVPVDFQAQVVVMRDHYAFGMEMPGQYALGEHRFGFNGKESDDEWNGEGNMYNYGFRIHDPRLGRFLSVDPLAPDYPWYTPYQYAGNTAIQAIDLDGLEEYKIIKWRNNEGLVESRIVLTDPNTQKTQTGLRILYFNNDGAKPNNFGDIDHFYFPGEGEWVDKTQIVDGIWQWKDTGIPVGSGGIHIYPITPDPPVNPVNPVNPGNPGNSTQNPSNSPVIGQWDTFSNPIFDTNGNVDVNQTMEKIRDEASSMRNARLPKVQISTPSVLASKTIAKIHRQVGISAKIEFSTKPINPNQLQLIQIRYETPTLQRRPNGFSQFRFIPAIPTTSPQND